MSAVRAVCLWLFAFVVLIGISTSALLETGCGSSGKAASGTTGGSGGGATGSPSGSGSGGGTTGAGPNASAQQFLYVAAGNGVSGWTINQDSSLTPISGSPFAVGGAGVIADPAANFVFSVGGTSPSNTALNTDAVNSDGSLKTSSTFSDSTLMGGMSINPSGTALYLASISAAQANTGWKIYSVQSDGSVKFVSGIINQDAGRLVFTSDGSNAYSAYCYHLDANILHFTVGSNGSLTPVTGQVTQIDSMTECPSAVALTPDGKTLAATWSNADSTGSPDNRIMLYSVDPTSHALSPISSAPFNASGAGMDAAFDSSGQFLVVAQDDGVGVYQVSSGTVKEVSGSPFAAGTKVDRVMFSPSGTSVAAMSNAGNQVYVFAFNSSNGTLTTGPGSPVSVSGPRDLTVMQ
jgi:6-phosphogluconolactonase